MVYYRKFLGLNTIYPIDRDKQVWIQRILRELRSELGSASWWNTVILSSVDDNFSSTLIISNMRLGYLNYLPIAKIFGEILGISIEALNYFKKTLKFSFWNFRLTLLAKNNSCFSKALSAQKFRLYNDYLPERMALQSF